MVSRGEVAGDNDPRHSFSEKAFGICALLYSSTAFIRLLMSADEYSAGGGENVDSPVKRVLWAASYIVAIYFLVRRRNRVRDALAHMPMLAALIGFIAASVLWSQSRTISVLSVAALVGNSSIGLYFGVRYRMAEFLRLLGWVYGMIAVSTLLAPIFISDYRIEEGSWVGFSAQKNSLGMNMVIGFLVFAALARGARKRKSLYICFSCLCATLVYLSGSATCIIVLFILVFLRICHLLIERQVSSVRSRTALILFVLVLSMAMFVSNWDRVLTVLGKSEDLTHRTGIWGAVLLMAMDKPLLGYGYGGFWVYGGPAQTVWEVLGVEPRDAGYAHNGYLQLLADCGITGLALLFGLLFTVVRDAWRFSVVRMEHWPIYFFAFMVLHNLAEATFVVRNNICWLLFVAIMTQMVLALRTEVRGRSPLAVPGTPGMEISSSPA